MKKIKNLILFLTMLTTVFTFTCSNAFAGDTRKETVRVVVFEDEADNCADELIYNGHRYLSGDYIADILAILINSGRDPMDFSSGDLADMLSRNIKNGGFHYSDTNTYKGTVSYNFSPTGYMSLWAGSTKLVLGNFGVLFELKLSYPAAMYDGKMYVAMEDIADVVGCSCGFDAEKNTMYFYNDASASKKPFQIVYKLYKDLHSIPNSYDDMVSNYVGFYKVNMVTLDPYGNLTTKVSDLEIRKRSNNKYIAVIDCSHWHSREVVLNYAGNGVFSTEDSFDESNIFYNSYSYEKAFHNDVVSVTLKNGNVYVNHNYSYSVGSMYTSNTVNKTYTAYKAYSPHKWTGVLDEYYY